MNPVNRGKSSSLLISIVYTVITLVVGAVISTSFQDLITVPSKPSVPLLFTIYDFLLILISVCLFGIVLMAISLIRSTKELQSRVGTKTTYVGSHQLDGRKILFRKAREVVEKAEERIWVLNSFAKEGEAEEHEDAELNQECDAYYKAILNTAINKRLEYYRIVQIPEGQTVKDLLQKVGDSYIKHFYDIRDVLDDPQKKRNLRIGFQAVSTKRLITFVLVDSTYLIWQINALLPSGQRQMDGIFIIEDPSGSVTKSFEAFFIEITRTSELKPILRDDLPPRPPVR